MKYREMRVAGCLGAIAGMAVAIVCEWSLVMLLPSALIGAITAFVCYRPLEVASAVREFGRDAREAMGRGMQKIGSIERGRVWRVTSTAVGVVACLLVGLGALFLVPTIAAMGGIVLPAHNRETPIIAMVVLEAVMSVVVGVLGLLVFCGPLGEIGVQWAMPLTRWAGGALSQGRIPQWLERIDEKECTRRDMFLLCLIGPVFFQVAGCLAAVALVVDAILTIILACATSERVAAVLGATLGFCAGATLHFSGVPWSLAILAASGTVGWFAGPLLYRLREHLSQEPATVQSS